MKILMVGCGSIGERHIRNLTMLLGDTIIACDTNPERFALITEKYGIQETYTELQEAIDQGGIGRILSARSEFGQYLPDWRPWPDHRQSYTAKNDLGGGIILDGSHEIDYMRWLLGDVDFVRLLVVRNNVKHAWHLFTILLHESIDRDEFFKYMGAANIGVNVHYIPVYWHSYYVRKFNFDKNNFTVTEDIFKIIITLPLFPKMHREDLFKVISAVKDFKLQSPRISVKCPESDQQNSRGYLNVK